MSDGADPDDLHHLFGEAESCARNDPADESEERWLAIAKLQEHSDRAVFDRAVQWCRADEPCLRSLGADVLAKLGWQDDCPFAGQSEAVLQPLLEDREPQVVASALHAHGFLGLGDSAQLRRFASHAAADVRHALAGCLAGREDDAAIATLIELSGDSDPEVRDWATFGIGTQCEVDTPAIREALLQRLEDDHDDTRCEAMVGLAKRGDQRIVALLETELASDAVGQLAIDAAGMLGDARFLPQLESLLDCNPDESSIREAIEQCRKP